MKGIDTTLELQLPWPADLQMTPAGPFLRFFALLIDHLLIYFAIFLLSAVSVFMMADTPEGEGFILFLYLVAIFIVYNGYFFLLEWLMKGQTPGKMVCGLRVLQMDGSEADVRSLLIRNFLRWGDMFPYLIGVWVLHVPTYTMAGIASVVLPHFRRLGDLAAGTVVVYDRSPLFLLRRNVYRRARNPDFKVYSLCHVDPMLYEAVARYMARRDFLSPALREEIAGRFYEDLKKIFAWTGPDPAPEELIERIYDSCIQDSRGIGDS
jgi:uncharacterized RDD family membrane protein YckC